MILTADQAQAAYRFFLWAKGEARIQFDWMTLSTMHEVVRNKNGHLLVYSLHDKEIYTRLADFVSAYLPEKKNV